MEVLLCNDYKRINVNELKIIEYVGRKEKTILAHLADDSNTAVPAHFQSFDHSKRCVQTGAFRYSLFPLDKFFNYRGIGILNIPGYENALWYG